MASYYKWDWRFHHVGNRRTQGGLVLRETVLEVNARSQIAAALKLGFAPSIPSEKRALGVATPNDRINGRYEHAVRLALATPGGRRANPGPGSDPERDRACQACRPTQSRIERLFRP